jgi:hypothetical protein
MTGHRIFDLDKKAFPAADSRFFDKKDFVPGIISYVKALNRMKTNRLPADSRNIASQPDDTGNCNDTNA